MSDIMKLKETTGAGVLECKKALDEVGGDFEKAVALLREKGKASAAKKSASNRIASEGAIGVYDHQGKGNIVVMVEINSETDFAAKSEPFQELLKDVAMQIAATNPLYLCEADVPSAVIENEKEILLKQAVNEGKKPEVAQKMVEGRVSKFYKENCLLNQEFVKDGSKTIKDIVAETIAKIGEKLTIRRFVRYEVGEGLEKKEENFAEEVAKQTQAK
ncbi:MAG: translation elongation factor Ts [Christensenellaceae bacterium]|jgi:elongation factor Ts|nr:translation elongation factor Ts [Christensenellaceae bacterium]